MTKQMLQIDRQNDGSVRMQIVTSERGADPCEDTLRAAPPIPRPTTLSEELWKRRRKTCVGELSQKVQDYLCDRYGDEVEVDVANLKSRLREYVERTSWKFGETDSSLYADDP